MQYFFYTDLNLPRNLPITIRPLNKLKKETELFPVPETDCFPVLPENLLLPFSKNTMRRPCFLVKSADYPLWNRHPTFLSEQDALFLAQKKAAKLFHDPVSNSTYFCYQSETQHMVWVEDGFHLLKKMQLLQKNGITEVAFPVFQYNIQTLLNLLQSLK